ncbi:hypothetical protein K491DRAFT_691862 [Lophiostoma macrostomum CBS 122681]|uniref:WD40 repeat-like protein n=1 Tax=Lophiostoma macrostomum CBS 122681 TaxID=1314788 RepID=A0A6A6TBI2_9PLEO|nr:hypothetical protein K491DRAFT_691862 [Lophiostoma macrostomum CBS 122681]
MHHHRAPRPHSQRLPDRRRQPRLPGPSTCAAFRPYATLASPDPIWAFAIPPKFDVHHGQSHVLVSTRDQNINLYEALGTPSTNSGPRNISTKAATYKLIDNSTKEVTAPLSLAFIDQGRRFVAGTRNTITMFTVDRPKDPTTSIRTVDPSRSKPEDGYKGIVTSLAISPPSAVNDPGILAAGTRNRQIGLYDFEGDGGLITHFSLPGSLSAGDGASAIDTKPAAWRRDPLEERMGDGVSDMKRSPCGTYLYIAENMSDALLIYDVRKTGLAVGFCVGRKAMTNHKLGFDLFQGRAGMEVWAGDIEGNMRVWRNPHQIAAPSGADEEYGRPVEAHVVSEVGVAPIVSTLVFQQQRHLYGGLLITAEGDDGGTSTGAVDRGCVSVFRIETVG